MMNNLEKHARDEFRAAGWMDENGKFNDEIQELICAQVLDLLNMFSKHGHSGTSAPYALNMFEKLARFKPIAPITGEDWEWVEISPMITGVEGPRYQNKRCSSIFKDDDGAYDIEGKVFWEWNVREDGTPYASFYSNKGCHLPITFPYIPGKRIEEYHYSDATPKAPPQTEKGLL
jgi:hypothetical protein